MPVLVVEPGELQALRQVAGGLAPEQIQQLMGGTAAELYKFDLEALRPAANNFGPTVAELAAPLTELPDGANQALLMAAAEIA